MTSARQKLVEDRRTETRLSEFSRLTTETTGGAEIASTMPQAPIEPAADEVHALDAASTRRLGDCLRTERSAVETYDLAMKSTNNSAVSRVLLQLRAAHDLRVTLIREHLRARGAPVPQGSGAWGLLAKLVQEGADQLSDKIAIGALEEFEDLALDLYRADSTSLDSDTRSFIDLQLLPEQQRTHDLCRSLKEPARNA